MSFMMAAAAAGTATQMASSYMSAKGEAGGMKNEAKQYKQAAERQRITAIQEEARRRDEMLAMTSTNVVDAVSRGQDAFTGTTGGLIERAQGMAQKEMVQVRHAQESEATKLAYAGALKKAQARQTMTSAYLQMGSKAISGGARMYQAS